MRLRPHPASIPAGFALRTRSVGALLIGLIVLTAPLAVPSAHAQRDPTQPDRSGQPPSLHFEQFSLEEGLVQHTVNALMQDSTGFLWIGTSAGLHRYDGHRFELYASEPFDTTSLSNGYVMSLAPARNGDVWVGTDAAGLNRLDPATGRAVHYRHNPKNPTGLASDRIRDVVQTSNGDVWVATYDAGVDRMRAGDEGRFLHYRHDPNVPATLSSDEVFALSEGPEGDIWAGTANGVSRIDPATGRVTRFLYQPPDAPDTRFSNTVYKAYFPPDAPGTAWLPTIDGLVRLDYHTGTYERFLPDSDGPPSPHDNQILALAPDPTTSDILWGVGVGTALVRFDTRSEMFTRYRHDPRVPNSLPSNDALRILTDRSGMIWVGTRAEGLSKFNPRAVNFTHLRHVPGTPQSLAPGAVWGLYKDASGTLWASTRTDAGDGSVTRFDAQTGRITRYRHDPEDPRSLPSGFARTLVKTSEDTLWVGHYYDGISRLNPETGTVTRFSHPRAETRPGRNTIHDFAPVPPDSTAPPDSRRGTSSGAHPKSTSSGAHPKSTSSGAHPKSTSSGAHPKGTSSGALWVGNSAGLDRFDTRTGTFERIPLDLDGDGTQEHPDIYTLHVSASGTLWAGTNGYGLLRVDDGRARVATQHVPTDSTTIASDVIYDIHEREDEPGVLWLGTQGGGLNRFDTHSGRTKTYLETDGLANNVVYSILEGDDGTLWMGTNHGISNFDPATASFRNYGTRDGLMTLEFNAGVAARGADGTLYFGSSEGVTAFSPNSLHTNTVPPPVVLTGLKVFNEPVEVGGSTALLEQPLSETDEIHLAHDQDQFTVQFAALHFEDPDKNTYAYQLDGYDDGWVNAGTRREAHYTNLSPGAYRFEVKATNADGVWNETPATVTIRIAPPWWRTWLAYGLYTLVLVGGIGGAFYWQRRRLERRQRRLEETVAERTSALRKEKQKTEKQAERLRELDRMKSRFFTNVSHEFRTPLTLTIGPLEDLQDGLSDETDAAEDASLLSLAREKVDLALRNSRRLLRLIGQLLDIAKLETGELHLDAQRADLATFVEDLARSFVPLAERRRVRFAVEAPDAPVSIAFDADKMEKLLTNLLSNAFKFTPTKGTIRVIVSCSADEATVTVRDNGPGIPDDEQAHLFNRFYQTETPDSEVQSGSGVGLSLAKDLAELHDGTISVESTVGQGSAFTVHLPFRDTRIPEIAPAPPLITTLLTPGPGQEASGSSSNGALPTPVPSKTADPDASPPKDDRTTLLIADDNPEIRAYVRSHFDDSYRILEAADGRAALEVAREALPDLIISDVMMPKLDGFGLVEALRATPETDFLPVILLTARATEEDKIEGLEEGADAYLTKPFNVRELQTRVEALIATRQRLKAHFAEHPPDAVPPENERPEPDDLSESQKLYLERVREVIQEHLADDDFGVEELAKAVGQSRSTLYRHLRDSVEQTPTDFLRTMRLQQATALLREGRGTVSEVAYAVGFKSVSHFSQTFRSAYDIPPSEYLNQSVSS